jgi:single-stranded-DNA-specific exonuclease
MLEKIWEYYPLLPEELKKAESSVSLLVRQLLYNRKLKTIEEMEEFLFNSLKKADFDPVGNWFSSYDPFLFKDMEKSVALIIEKIKNQEKILIYGDYDVDGVTSTVLMLNILKTLKAKVDIYLPDRVSEGYGLNKEAIDKAKEAEVSLIITVDNGIRNYKEVEYAKEIGLDIIITDHHVLPEDIEEIPNCPIINSADLNSRYPFKLLAGVGVAFKLASALIDKAKIEKSQKKMILEKNLDLVALGTIADLVPLIGENRLLAQKGLEVLNRNNRLGINALVQIISRSDKDLKAWNIAWQLAPRLNAASRIGHANSALALLNSSDKNEAKELAYELNKRNTERQEITKRIIAQVEAEIDENNLEPIIIGTAKEIEFWNEGVIGLVSGKITDKYHRPSLIISRIVEEANYDEKTKEMKAIKTSFKGSGRSIEGFNLIKAIEKTSKYLDKYGGHPMACGFSIKDEKNYHKFKELIKEEAKKIDPLILKPKLKIDALLNFSDINMELILDLEKLAPYGQNNWQAKLSSKNVVLNDLSYVGGEGQHVKLRFSQDNIFMSAIFFNGQAIGEALEISANYDIVYYLDINEFNGKKEIQLKIIDIKLCKQ